MISELENRFCNRGDRKQQSWWSGDGGNDALDIRTIEEKSANVAADPKDVVLLKK